MKKLKERNGFLITCVSCIMLLLVIGYLGINGVAKGTYSAYTNPSGTCPSGTTQGGCQYVGSELLCECIKNSGGSSKPATEDGPSSSSSKPSSSKPSSSGCPAGYMSASEAYAGRNACKYGGSVSGSGNCWTFSCYSAPSSSGDSSSPSGSSCSSGYYGQSAADSAGSRNCSNGYTVYNISGNCWGYTCKSSTGTTCNGYTSQSAANAAGNVACSGSHTVITIKTGCYMYSCNGTGGTGSYQCWFNSGKYEWGTSGSYPVSDSYCKNNGNSSASSASSSSNKPTGSCPAGYYSYSVASNLANAMCENREIKYTKSSTNSSCYTYSCVGDNKVYTCDDGKTTQTTSTCTEDVDFSSQLPLTLSKACETYLGEGYTGTCTQTDNGDDNNAGTPRYSYSCNCKKKADVFDDGCEEGYTYSNGKCIVDKCPTGMTSYNGECHSTVKHDTLTCKDAYGDPGTNQEWVGSCTSKYSITHGWTTHTCSCSKTCKSGFINVNGSCVIDDIKDDPSSDKDDKCYYEDRDECEYISDRGCQKDSNGCYIPGGTGTYQCWFYNGSYVMSNYGSYPVDDTYCRDQKEVKCNEGELSVHPNGDSSSNWVCKVRSVDGGGVCYYGCTNIPDGKTCSQLTNCDASKGQYAALDENGNCVCACDCDDGECDTEKDTAKQCWICGSNYVWNYASAVDRSNCRLTIKTEGNCTGKAPSYPGNPGTPTNPSNPTNPKPSSNGGNVTQNPQTGQILMFIIWIVAFAAIGYSIYYFKKVRES